MTPARSHQHDSPATPHDRVASRTSDQGSPVNTFISWFRRARLRNRRSIATPTKRPAGTQTSVAMTATAELALRTHLLRPDGQEDLCLATYRPSTGRRRRTALITTVELPRPGEREVHGNATITGEYMLRVAATAAERGEGVVLLHSHPHARSWQQTSGPDFDTESSYANLAREITGYSLIGMTLAGADTTWSARHWDHGTGANIKPSHCHNVRVLGEQLQISWNEALVPPPRRQVTTVRTVSSWGSRVHDDLTRRSVLVVGLGSVGLDVAVRLAATGITHLGLMDFDTVKPHNLDRLIGATPLDAWLHRSKIDVAARIVAERHRREPGSDPAQPQHL